MSLVDVTVDIDQAKAWELYQLLGGDCAQVAAALGGSVREADVVMVAQRFDWADRYRSAVAATGSVVALNRARNGAQALRLQRLLDGVLESIEEGKKEAISEWTTQIIGGAAVKSGAPLMQLAKAIETAQHLTYRALGDTGEQTKAAAAGEESLLSEMSRAFDKAAEALAVPPAELAQKLVP